MAGKTLDVFYHGKVVGTLAEMPDKRIAFQYSDEWIRDGFAISPLSLPLKNTVFVPPEKSREYFGGLFGIFADSLPDNWGALLLNRYLESIGISASSINALDRLAYIGHSGMGALEYHPSKEADFNMDTAGINYDSLARECSKILSSKMSKQLDLLFRIAGSSGGTRPKVLLTENHRFWIVKFPAKEDSSISGKCEYDYSLCAKNCGIIMTETALIESAVCDGYFKTERFDRKGSSKIMTASFAGLLETDFRAPTCDYSTYMKLVRVLTKDSKSDKDQLYRIMCFNILTNNLDDHSKNFSFTYTEKSGWKLAPAYDLTYSNTYFGEHTTSVLGKGKDISDADLIKVGTDAGLSLKFCKDCLKFIKKQTEDLQPYLEGPFPKRKSSRLSSRINELK